MALSGKLAGIIDKVAAELAACPETIGVFLHGSVLSGTERPDSDVDLLCVTDADWYSLETRDVEGRKVEIQRKPLPEIQRELRQKTLVNNNFPLNTLCDGKVIWQRGEALSELIEEAQAMRAAGPPAPTAQEIYFGRTFFGNRLNEIRHLVRQGGPRSEGKARLFADFLFHRAVYAYCKTHRRWSSKFDRVVESLCDEEPELRDVYERFLSARDSARMLEVLEEFLDRVMAPVGWGDGVEDSGRIPLQKLAGRE